MLSIAFEAADVLDLVPPLGIPSTQDWIMRRESFQEEFDGALLIVMK